MFHLKILCVLFKATSFLDRNNDGCDYFAQFLVSLIDFLIAINNVNSGYVITLLALLCSAEQPDHNVQVEFLLKCSIQGASPLPANTDHMLFSVNCGRFSIQLV